MPSPVPLTHLAEPADPPVPAVAIRVRVPAAAAPGKELEYRFRVENISQAPAHHVVVRNPLPAHARFVRANPEPDVREPELEWHLKTLEARASKEIVLVVLPTGTGDVKNCARVQFEHGECVTTRLAKAELTLEKRAPTQALRSDFMTYQIVVTNAGGAEAHGVEVMETLPEGLEHKNGRHQRRWELGTLAPGQSRRLEYEVLARDVGKHCDRYFVVAMGGLRKEASHCVVVTEPQLDLQVQGPTGAPNYVKMPAPYQITVRNPGTSPATRVVVKARLPANSLLVSTSAGGQRVGDEVQWQVGTLPPGGQRALQLVLQALAAGELRSQVTATADRSLKAEGEARSVFTAFDEPVGIHLSVRNEEGNLIEVGGTTRYTIEVVNQGRAPANKVRLLATVPEEMEIQDTKPKATPEGQKVAFAPFDLEPGRTASYEIVVKAKRSGEASLKVEMSAEQLPKAVRHERSTTIFNPEGK
jgi:uncharacterized repeat protein (TIGR01451 family)